MFSANGVPMVGGTLTVYVAGTTTPTNTWQDSELTIANTNPISLDARGECVLWLDPAVVYKFVLKNAQGVIQWTQDNISNPAALANSLRADLAASSGASLVGYMPAGTGAVATDVQAVLRETVSINRFKNAAAIAGNWTTAFAALKAHAIANKSIVDIPAGTYVLDSATDLAAADTEWRFAPGAILKLSDTQATTSFITFSNPVNQRVIGLRVDANRAVQNAALFGQDNCAVLMVGPTNCDFDSIEIISSPAKGFALVSAAAGFSRNTTITNFQGANCNDQCLLVDGNNMLGFFENIVIDGVRIWATSHAGVALNDGAHNISLSNVIADVQNSVHDAVSVRDSYDIQMSNIKGKRGRNGIQLERLNGFTGRIEMSNVLGEANSANGVLLFGAENVTGSAVGGFNNASAGLNIAQTGASYRCKNVSISSPVGYDNRGVPAQQYGVLVQGLDRGRLGRHLTYGNTVKNFTINRAVTSDIEAEVTRTITGTTGNIVASSEAVVALTWPTAFDDADVDIDSIYVTVGTSSRSLVVGHVVVVNATVVHVLVLNLGSVTHTGVLTVIGRRRT